MNPFTRLSDPRIALTWTAAGTLITPELRADADRRRTQLTYSEQMPLVLHAQETPPGAVSVTAAREDYAILTTVRDSQPAGVLGSISVSTLLTCNDGLILGVRAEHLDTAAGHLSATASEGVNTSDVQVDDAGSFVDVNAVSRRALLEELGLQPEHSHVEPLLALVHRDGLAVFTASFTTLSFADVLHCQKSAEDWEATLELCPATGLEAGQRPVISWLPTVYSQWRDQWVHRAYPAPDQRN